MSGARVLHLRSLPTLISRPCELGPWPVISPLGDVLVKSRVFANGMSDPLPDIFLQKLVHFCRVLPAPSSVSSTERSVKRWGERQWFLQFLIES